MIGRLRVFRLFTQTSIATRTLVFALVCRYNLQDLHVSDRDYDPEDNPAMLHQKELLVRSDYLLYEKFANLSRQEADWGLLDDLGKIRDRRGWQKCLDEHCAELKGHRLLWRQDADSYRVKLQRSLIRSRKLDQTPIN